MFMVYFTDLISMIEFPELIFIRNPDEARKAYLNALKYEKDNQNVLRDLG